MSLNDSHLYNCITNRRGTKEFYVDHDWKFKRILGILPFYICSRCNKTITKKRYLELNEDIDIFFF